MIDHHELQKLPKAYALINPKRKDYSFSRERAGCLRCDILFSVGIEKDYAQQWFAKVKINLKRELDIVALGTMADMVSSRETTGFL